MKALISGQAGLVVAMGDNPIAYPIDGGPTISDPYKIGRFLDGCSDLVVEDVDSLEIAQKIGAMRRKAYKAETNSFLAESSSVSAEDINQSNATTKNTTPYYKEEPFSYDMDAPELIAALIDQDRFANAREKAVDDRSLAAFTRIAALERSSHAVLVTKIIANNTRYEYVVDKNLMQLSLQIRDLRSALLNQTEALKKTESLNADRFDRIEKKMQINYRDFIVSLSATNYVGLVDRFKRILRFFR